MFQCEESSASDILENNQFIPSENLKSQLFLEEIGLWTKNQKMKINNKKRKTMIFNFSKNHQFSTRLELENEILEIVKETKLLGTIISDNLKWDKNTENIVKKCNKRMELLRKVSSFGASWDELKIFIYYILEAFWNNLVLCGTVASQRKIAKTLKEFRKLL